MLPRFITPSRIDVECSIKSQARCTPPAPYLAGWKSTCAAVTLRHCVTRIFYTPVTLLLQRDLIQILPNFTNRPALLCLVC